MKKENRSSLVKIIIYSVLILLFVFVYLRFGLVEDTNSEYKHQTEEPIIKLTPEPTQQPFPYRSDVEAALLQAGIPVYKDSYTEIYPGNYLYKFTYGLVQEEASVVLCVDKADCVVSAELEFYNLKLETSKDLYLDENELIFEIQKRNKDNIDLITAFVVACTECMAMDEVISFTEISMLYDSIVNNYLDDSDYKDSRYGISYQLSCDVPYGLEILEYYRLILKSKKG